MVRSLPVTLQKDEEVLAVVRRSAFTVIFKILFTLVWFLLPFLFFFPLLRLGGVGIAVFALLLCGALFYAWRFWKTFRQTMLIVTDRRVIDVDQSSWRTSQMVDVPLAEVKTVVTERESFIGGLFDLGMIRIETGDGASFDLEWSGVRHPQVVADLLREVRSLHRH
jgi:uncharacterized membrane protein YqjE